MSYNSRTAQAIYAQQQFQPPSLLLTSTGLIATSRVHFSQPIEIIRLLLLQNVTDVLVDTAIRWDVVSVIGGSTVVRSTQQLVVPATMPGASGVGLYCDLANPVRVDPGEEAVVNVIDASGAADAIFPGFMYRAYGFGGPAFAFDQYGNPPENHIGNMTEVIAV